MDKTREIGGTFTPVTGQLPPKTYTYSKNYSSPKKRDFSRKLRNGEIVLGSVIEVLSDDVAMVRLPIGNFKASMNSQLKQGDKLFFLVMDNSTFLTLKPHSVYSKINGLTLSDTEIVRILDLPATTDSLILINFLKFQRNLVVRDHFLAIMKNYFNLDNKLKEKFSKTTLFKTLFWLEEADLESDNELVNKLAYSFRQLSQIAKLITSEINSNNQVITKVLKRILNSNTFRSNLSFSTFSENSLFSILDKLISGGNSGEYNELFYLLEGLFAWNSFAYRSNLPSHLYLPYIAGSEIKVSHLVIQNSDRKLAHKTEKIDFQNYGVDIAEFIISKMSVDVAFGLNSTSDELQKKAMQLRDALLVLNFELLGFIIEIDDKEIDLLPEYQKTTTPNISFVV